MYLFALCPVSLAPVHAPKYADRSFSAALKAVADFYATSHENAKVEVRQ